MWGGRKGLLDLKRAEQEGAWRQCWVTAERRQDLGTFPLLRKREEQCWAQMEVLWPYCCSCSMACQDLVWAARQRGLEGVALGLGLIPGEGTPPLQVSLHLQSPAFTWKYVAPILHPPGAAHLAPIGCLSVCWGSGWRLAGTLQIPTASGCRKIQFSS